MEAPRGVKVKCYVYPMPPKVRVDRGRCMGN